MTLFCSLLEVLFVHACIIYIEYRLCFTLSVTWRWEGECRLCFTVPLELLTGVTSRWQEVGCPVGDTCPYAASHISVLVSLSLSLSLSRSLSLAHSLLLALTPSYFPCPSTIYSLSVMSPLSRKSPLLHLILSLCFALMSLVFISWRSSSFPPE